MLLFLVREKRKLKLKKILVFCGPRALLLVTYYGRAIRPCGLAVLLARLRLPLPPRRLQQRGGDPRPQMHKARSRPRRHLWGRALAPALRLRSGAPPMEHGTVMRTRFNTAWGTQRTKLLCNNSIRYIISNFYSHII